MKNNIKNTLCSFYSCFLFLVIGMLVSCKSNSIPLSNKAEVNTITTKEIVKDTIFLTQKESSYYSAWLECIEEKVQIKGDPISIPGKYLKPPKVSLQGNQLKVDCNAEAQKLFAQWKDTYKTASKVITITKIVYVERKLSWWQTFQIFCGRVLLTLALYYLIRFLLKTFKLI